MPKRKEILYQFLLTLLLFVILIFDEEGHHLHWGYLMIAFNYMLAASFMNYFLLPRFYYKRKYLQFWGFSILVTLLLVLLEEMVLEPIFVPELYGDYDGIFFAITDIVPVMIILVGFKFAWDANERRKELDQLKQLMAENEMQFLKAQINPHFLFNNLNNLYSYALEKSDKTPVIIYKLSEVLRYMLYECHEKIVPLKNEVKHLENFIQLNRLQMEHRGEVSFCHKNITNNHKLAPLLLIVFVENAFKHSLSSLSKGIQININAKVEKDTLEFFCSNNYSEESNLNNLSSGIGLENVNSQLNLLYPEKHTINIKKKDKLFVVKLRIKMI